MTPVQFTAAMKTIGWCITALTLTGCISMHSMKTESEFSAPPVNPKVCNYDWQVDMVLSRAEYVWRHDWKAPDGFGNGAATPRIDQLAAACPQPPPARPAKVSAYYLEHGNKVYGWTSRIVAKALWIPTLGTLPLPLSTQFVTCIQTTSDDGLSRYAITEGEISTLVNIWGVGPRFGAERAERTSKLLADLTTQAWAKMWLLEAENLGAEDCRSKLDALAGGPH
jgi:hypothetical protein